MDIERIRQVLAKEGDIGIALSSNYTVDEVAAALGLYLVLKNVGRNVQVVSRKQPSVEISHLFSIDKVQNNFQSKSGDLVVSFPYREGEIEKISYTMEGGLLNIVVKAGEKGINFSDRDVRFNRSGNAPSILITIGIRNLDELSFAFDKNALSTTEIINIDNKANNQMFGTVVAVVPTASTVSELTSDMLYSLGYNFDPDSSQNFLTGMISATNNFQNTDASGLAFEMAGILMRSGAQRKLVQSQPVGQPQSQPMQNQQRTQQQPQQNNQGQPRNPQAQQNNQGQTQQQKTPPPDWLAPKIFKGSTNLE
jgi:nanoRNase/pAp phosphatase (c-di-AMP/oligoRNAs hydrolase)